jgi:cyclopropane-fatty-acyl-phospholipid synthase
MTVLTTLDGQTGLPRYFAQVFEISAQMKRGRLDWVLPDGRRFRVAPHQSGPIAEVHIHDSDVFARLVREGELGFCDAYLDGGWSTPDLQTFMDLVQMAGKDGVYGAFQGHGIIRAYERLRFWLQSNTKRQARKNISQHYDLGNAF